MYGPFSVPFFPFDCETHFLFHGMLFSYHISVCNWVFLSDLSAAPTVRALCQTPVYTNRCVFAFALTRTACEMCPQVLKFEVAYPTSLSENQKALVRQGLMMT